MKEQVIEGSACAEMAHRWPDQFEVKLLKDACINIRVSSNVRQIGKTTLTELIKKTLIENGYTNITHVSHGKSTSTVNTVSPPVGNNATDILIRVVDENA